MRLLVALISSAFVCACIGGESVDDRFLVEGELDRESIEGTSDEGVTLRYESAQARAEWWPCELRLTAAGCVDDDKHVNVYVSLPQAVDLGDLGGSVCVQDPEVPTGVFALVKDRAPGIFEIGVDLQVFVLVASDLDDTPGALLDNDAETKAATAMASGSVEVIAFRGQEGIDLRIEGTTRDGRELSVAFTGLAQVPPRVGPLEDARTCVSGALILPDAVAQ